MASRSLKDLTLEAQDAFEKFELALQAEGLAWFKRCCTYRSQAEQNALWCRGRYKLAVVNATYKAAGLAPITEAENKRPVTWARKSVHTQREAVDYFIEKDGRYCTDVKVDINDNDVPDWVEFGRVAVACGLEWGGKWSNPDLPHVQLKKVR